MNKMNKLKVGQYWHHPENGDEWLILKRRDASLFTCECTKKGGDWEFSEIESWDLDEFNDSGYVLGRHPDNIEPRPEQWQPKEGELVWSKGNKIKMKAHYNFNGNVFYTGEKGYIGGGVFEIEPYANQDAKIDFSIAGQWVRCGNTIVQTSGTHDKGHIYVYFLGDGLNEAKKVSKLFKWQLLTPEQVQPLLDAIAALTENQSD